MADDLMDFTDSENKENSIIASQDENDIQVAPGLVQSPVIVKSILKQCNKDNLIQLYTPVQKPDKGRLKVHFGHDSLLQTPNVKQVMKVKGEVAIKEDVETETKAEDTENIQAQKVDNNVAQTTASGTENIQAQKVNTIVAHTTASGTEVVKDTEKEVVNNASVEVAKEILSHVIDEIPIKDDIDSSGSADSGIGECAMEVSISEPTTAETFGGSSDIDDILRQSEMLLRSLRGDLFSEKSTAVDSSQASKTPPCDVTENSNEPKINYETKSTEVKAELEKMTDPVACVKESSEDSGNEVTSKKNLADDIEKDGNKTNEIKADEVREKEAEIHSSVKEEEPMEVEEAMEVDDDEDDEIVFNFGDNKTAAEVSDVNKENLSNFVEKTIVTSEANENSTSEIERKDDITGDNNHVEKADIDKVDDNIEGKTENLSSKDSNVKEECAESNKSQESTCNYEGAKLDGEKFVDKPDETTITLNDEKTKAVQAQVDVENAVQDIKLEAKKKGDESSDEEFMSADENMDVDEVKTPCKSTLPETQNQQDMNIKSEEDSPERIPPKVGYNLNFDDLDAMDPFSTKKALVNSPDLGKKADKKTVLTKPDVPGVKSDTTDSKISEVTEHFKSANSSPVKSEPLRAEVILSPNAVLVDQVCQDKTAGDIFEEKPDCLLQDDSTLPNDGGKLTEDVKSSSHTGDTGQEEDIKRELDFDNIDPFKPKTQIVNTPDKSTHTKSENSFQASNHISNIPVKAEVNANVNVKPDTCAETKFEELPSVKVEKIEQQKPEEITATPQKEIIENKQPPTMSPEIPVLRGAYNLDALDMDEIDPFKPSVQMANSPCGNAGQTNLDIDTFKPKKQIMNSPCVIKESSETKHGKDNPLKPKAQTVISPDSDKKVSENADAYKTETVISKPVVEEKPLVVEEKPFKEANNMKTLEDITDPFKTVSQIANSPQKLENEIKEKEKDPFKSKNKIQNSPVKSAFNITCNNANSDILDEIDPFKPRNQMQNSPVSNTIDCSKKKQNLECLENVETLSRPPCEAETKSEILDIEFMDDPFKPKNQMQNSPILKAKVNVADKGKTEVPETEKDDTLTSDSVDPFSNVDPFKSKKQLAMSPPLKSGSQVDPFADLNPFQTKSTVVNSPEKNGTESVVNEVKAAPEIDPFKRNGGICNSPALTTIEEMPFATRSRVANTPTKDDPFSTTNEPSGQEGGLGDVFEVQGVTRRGEEGLHANEFADIDESQFVSASQVFNDPAAWEMLEKLGGSSNESGESALSRMSLYVKFDPLVDEAPINPRRISIRVSQLEKVKEYGLDETLLLLGTPPKKRRQSLARNISAEPKLSTSIVTQPPPKNAEPVGATPGAVDLILAYSPEKKDQIEKNCEKVEGPVMNLLEDIDSCVDTENIFQELKYTEADFKKFQQDNKLAMQGILINKDKEWCKKEKEWKKKEAELIKKYQNREKDCEKLEQAFLALEKTVYEIAAVKEAAEKKVEKIAAEKAQALEDILAVEKAFSDLHGRYEKAKAVVMSMKENEDRLKKATADSLEKQKSLKEQLHEVKKSAEEKLAASKAEIEKLIHQRDSIQNKFDAHIKMTNIKIGNLETTVQKRTEENKELTEICENLLSKADS